MTNHEKNMVLAVIRHHMDSDLRRKVMAQVPQAYNAWMEGEYVEVRHVSDDRKVEV